MPTLQRLLIPTSGGQIWSTLPPLLLLRGDCTSDFRHICEWNRVSGSGTWPDLEDTEVLSAFEIYKRSLIGHTGVSNIPSNVTANAGIEKP